MAEPIDPSPSEAGGKVTEAIDKEIIEAKGGILSPEAIERIQTEVQKVNDSLKTEDKFEYKNGELKFGQATIKLTIADGQQPLSYTEGMSGIVERINNNASTESKNDIQDTCENIARQIGVQIGLEGDALQIFTDAKATGLKQTFTQELNRVAELPQSSEAAKAATSEIVDQKGLNNENAEQTAPQEPRTPADAASLQQRAANPKGIDKVIIDSYSKVIPEEAQKAFQDKATKIANDTKMTIEEKETALEKLFTDTLKENIDKLGSETWGEKLSRWGGYLIEAFKLLGGFLMFALNLLPAILLIIFSYGFVERWAKSHTGCFMDMSDSSNTVKKSYKVKGLTCSNDYRNAMDNFQDYPDYIKECTKITPIPAPPQGCQPCDDGIKAGTSDCPCPDNSDPKGVYASQWCDSKFLTSSDGTFSHNYYKRYYSWMDAFVEIGSIFTGFITGFKPLTDGSFLGKLFQLLEGFGILALVFVGIYGLLWMAKNFGIIGGKGGNGTTVVIEEEKHHGETYQTTPQVATQVATQVTPQATCATDYSKCTKDELDNMPVPTDDEKFQEYTRALENASVGSRDYAQQQVIASQQKAKDAQKRAKDLAAKQEADAKSALQKQREQEIQEQQLILQQRQHEVQLQELKNQQTQQLAKLQQKPEEEDLQKQIDKIKIQTALVTEKTKLQQAQDDADTQKIAIKKQQERKEAASKKQREQEDRDADKAVQIEEAKHKAELARLEKISQKEQTKAYEAILEKAKVQKEAQAAQQSSSSSSSSSSLIGTPSPGGPQQIPQIDVNAATAAVLGNVQGRMLSAPDSPGPLNVITPQATPETTPKAPMFGQASLPRYGRFRARKSIRASRRMLK